MISSAVTLGEFGPSHRFIDALRNHLIRILDSTCPAVHAALQRPGRNACLSFPLRGLIGSDLLARRKDWKVIDNPFQPGDPIAVLPAINPDIALFHAPLANRSGNVYIGRKRELLTMAHASKQTFVTVEAVTERNLFDDPKMAPGIVPALRQPHRAGAKRRVADRIFRALWLGRCGDQPLRATRQDRGRFPPLGGRGVCRT